MLAQQSLLSLEDLAGADFVRVSPTLGVDFQEHVESHCRRAGFHPRVVVEAADTNAVIGFVAAGFGVAIVPEYTSRMGHTHVVFRRIRRLPVQVDLAVAWVTSDTTSLQSAFISAIEEYMGQHPLE